MPFSFSVRLKTVAATLTLIVSGTATSAEASAPKPDSDRIATAEAGEPPIQICTSRHAHRAAITGARQDAVWIYTKGSGGNHAPALKDSLLDAMDLACAADVHFGPNFVAVRYGRNRDLWAMYGIRPDGGVVVSKFDIRDGQQHDFIANAPEHVSDNEFLVVYGTKRDRTMRFCFDGETWTRSSGARGATFAPGCRYKIQLY